MNDLTRYLTHVVKQDIKTKDKMKTEVKMKTKDVLKMKTQDNIKTEVNTEAKTQDVLEVMHAPVSHLEAAGEAKTEVPNRKGRLRDREAREASKRLIKDFVSKWRFNQSIIAEKTGLGTNKVGQRIYSIPYWGSDDIVALDSMFDDLVSDIETLRKDLADNKY